MTSSEVVRTSLVEYYSRIQAELHELVQPLSTAQIWAEAVSVWKQHRQSDPPSHRKFGLLHWHAARQNRLCPALVIRSLRTAESRFTALLRCAGHAYHHVGQIIYLQRELLKEA
jgi:hypothetical protein